MEGVRVSSFGLADLKAGAFGFQISGVSMLKALRALSVQSFGLQP